MLLIMTCNETTALAIRVARAFTGRQHLVKFEAHFHGLHDAVMAAVKDPFEIPVSAGVPPSTLSTTLVARNNDLAHVTELLDDHGVAAVILEPAGARSMTVPTDPAFLKALRQLTRDRGVILIFDEVVTGFRMAPGGAQEYYGVTADLTCLAKAVAGGLPGAALVGRADLLDAITLTGDAKRDRTRRVADQGTYSGTPLIAAAGVAALEILKTGEVQRELNRLGDRLRRVLICWARPASPAPSSDSVPTSGVTRTPRISPPGNKFVWMFKYDWPSSIPANSPASALAAVPLAVRNAGLYVESSNVLN